MRFKFAGNKGDRALTVIKNNEVSLSIKVGAPVFQDVSTAIPTVLGTEVVSAESLANARQGFFAGLCVGTDVGPSGGDMAVGDVGESIVYGFYDYARVLLSTRATSTDVWASYSAIALGDIMSFVTTAGVQAIQRSGAGSATANGWWLQAAQSLVSQTTQASSITNGPVGNSTAMITQLRVRVVAF